MGTARFHALIMAVGLPLLGIDAYGQRLVELTIAGPGSIAEGATVSYTSTAHFDDGSEFDVTLPSTWAVTPSGIASIDTFGTLVAGRVTQDEMIAVECTFTWLDVTLESSFAVTIVDVPKDEGIHPWPEWQRTVSRLGRTSTNGPQTPTIDWSIQVDFSTATFAPAASPVMDADNQIILGLLRTVASVDTLTREIKWEFVTGDTVVSSPTIWDDRIVFGSSIDFVFCLDRRTGNEIWSEPALPHPNRGQAIDDSLPGGVVYYPVDFDTIYARRVEDGSEVWTVPGPDAMNSPPTLDGLGFFYQGSAGGQDLSGFATIDGSGIWDAPVGTILGPTPYHNGKVYASSVRLYCVDTFAGDIDWTFEDIGTTNSAIAVGHDGTIYASEVGSGSYMFAVTPDGKEMWRYLVDESVKFPPIVAGDGTIYICSFRAPNSGHVHAVRPDGKALWVMEMPDYMEASPMLAPDGTLYAVCRDKRLYAFRDPPGDFDRDGDVDLVDFARFQLCFTGPRVAGTASLLEPGCELADFDNDWDTDLVDFGEFTLAYTGS